MNKQSSQNNSTESKQAYKAMSFFTNRVNIIKKIRIHFVIFMLLVIPFFVLAQSGITPSPSPTVINIPNPTTAGDTLMAVLTAILNKVVMPIAAVAVVMWIIYAGFTFVTAQGNPKLIEDAKQRLLWSLIGAGILLGAAAISSVVKNTVEGLLVP